MNLTFQGFLRGYCRELTGLQTSSLRKLSAAVATDAPAAAEALMAFAAVQGKADYLARLSEGTWMEGDYRQRAAEIGQASDISGYLASAEAPARYQKVWNAYLAKRDAAVADRRAIELMREKTLSALEETGTTVYRLCIDLGLNLGNIYSYLHGGNVMKVSRATARRIMDHACSIA